MALSLVSTRGWGPQERRRRSEIPDLIAINPHGELPQSGAADFAGNPPGQAAAASNFPGNFPGTLKFPGEFPCQYPGNLTGGFPGNLDAASDFPGNCPGAPHGIPREIGCRITVPGTCPGKSSSREIPRGIRARRPDCAVFGHSEKAGCEDAKKQFLTKLL